MASANWNQKAATTQRISFQCGVNPAQALRGTHRADSRNRRLENPMPDGVVRLRKGNRNTWKPIQTCIGSRDISGLLFIQVLVGYSCDLVGY